MSNNTKAVMDFEVDDDGRVKRTGNVWTATTHIITCVIGAGVLALAWAMAQLGWIAGILSILLFACISLFTYNLVADCYRYPDPVNGKRNYTYMQAVKVYLGGRMYVICGIFVYAKLAGITVGYTITSARSLAAIGKTVCLRNKGHQANCTGSYNPYTIGFGILQLFLSQIPNFHTLTWLSSIAAITSFGYVLIAIGLSFSVLISGKSAPTSIFGTKVGQELSAADKNWRICSSFGNIALACNYATVIYDIMDSLRSTPSESKQMKKANLTGLSTMTIIFLLCSCLGYAAFGDKTPGNIFAGFSEPYWLVAIGEICIVIHMVGAYQVMAQPFFRIVEIGANILWPDSNFIKKDYQISVCKTTISMNLFRLIWRTIFVIIAAILAMAFPFFNEVLSLLGALGFGPLVVFFPVQMHIAQKSIKVLSLKWCAFQILNCLCLFVSLVAVVASVHQISQNLHRYKIFGYTN